MDRNKFQVIESNPKHRNRGLIVLGIFLLLAIAVGLLITQFRITKINVSGNQHYTEGEMIAELKKEGYVDNTILYMLKCKVKNPRDIPFVETMDVEYVDRNTISVTIYEKTMAGCIENMGAYIYFDKDGIVLESSEKRFDDVPLVNGLEFDSVVINEKLPFEDKKTVKQILNITQLIRKYELEISTVKFDTNGVSLYWKDIEIILGDPSDIDEKMAELPNMLEKAEGLKGTLHMEKFSVNSGIASFTPK